MKINSREKGKRGERQWRDELRANGYEARRGQQFSGSPDSPDVVCPDLDWAHFEVKAVERLNIEGAMEQARKDAKKSGESRNQGVRELVPIVAHRRNFSPWLVTVEADWLFDSRDGFLSGGCFFAEHTGKRLNLRDAIESAQREAKDRVAFVVHGRNGMRLVTMMAGTFFRLLAGMVGGVCLKRGVKPQRLEAPREGGGVSNQ